MRPKHKVFIQTDDAGGVIERLIAAVIDGVHHLFIEIGRIHTLLADNAPGCRTASGYRAIVEKQHFGIGGQTHKARIMHRKVRDDSAGRLYGEIVSFGKAFNFHDIVAVEGSAYNRAQGAGHRIFKGDFTAGILIFG